MDKIQLWTGGNSENYEAISSNIWKSDALMLPPKLVGRVDGADEKKSKSSDAVSELDRDAVSELLSLTFSEI